MKKYHLFVYVSGEEGDYCQWDFLGSFEDQGPANSAAHKYLDDHYWDHTEFTLMATADDGGLIRYKQGNYEKRKVYVDGKTPGGQQKYIFKWAIWWEDDEGIFHDGTKELSPKLKEAIDNAWLEKKRKW